MAKRSKKKRLNKSMADTVLEFAEGAWPYIERLVLEAVRAMPQLTEPPKKKPAKRRAKARSAQDHAPRPEHVRKG